MTTPPLLNWMLLSTFCLGSCWLLYRLLLRREACFTFNRAFLLLAPLLAAVVPLVSFTALWPVPEQVSMLPAAVWLPEVQLGGAPAEQTLWPLLQLTYGLGVAAMLGRTGWQLLRLRRLTRGLPNKPQAGYSLRPTGGQLPTSSFGRTIYWDETAPLSAAEAAQVLRHELAHVQQGHTADRLWLQLWRAVLWFNPFVHACFRDLHLTHEYLADAAAVGRPLAAPAAPAAYATLLARLAACQLGLIPPPVHAFITSQTLQRIAMLHRTTPVRRWKQWLALPAAVLLLAVVACDRAAVRPDSPFANFDFDQVQQALAPPPKPAADSLVLEVADKYPEYPGGLEKLLHDLTSNIEYPKAAAPAGWEGRVFVSFVVGSDGYVRETRIEAKPKPTDRTKSYANACEVATLMAMQAISQQWQPGEKDGKPVAVQMVVPVVFKK